MKVDIVMSCINCVHCHRVDIFGEHTCSKGVFFRMLFPDKLCNEWRPSKKEVQLWIDRHISKLIKEPTDE